MTDAAAAASPTPVADVDNLLRTHLRGYHRARWITVTGIILLLSGAVILLSVLYGQQQARLRASCQYWKVLAPLAAVATPPATRPSRTLIVFITGARTAYAGQACGVLPAADPSLLRWAAYYGIKVP